MADAGRVIAGTAKGTRLVAPGPATRPLADRVKQTLFAVLEPDLVESRVLDLFAGSGAAGIEALSRGAEAAVFVDRDASAIRAIRENLARAGFDRRDQVTVSQAEAIGWLERQRGSDDRFTIAIVDPPYAKHDLLARVLVLLGWEDAPLAGDARVVAKHFWRDRPAATVGLLASERERRFGETALTFYRRREADRHA
jgi:16S rRNA (guanine966-N2)-methyltransferase